jgi:hypothetical protein
MKPFDGVYPERSRRARAGSAESEDERQRRETQTEIERGEAVSVSFLYHLSLSCRYRPYSSRFIPTLAFFTFLSLVLVLLPTCSYFFLHRCHVETPVSKVWGV